MTTENIEVFTQSSIRIGSDSQRIYIAIPTHYGSIVGKKEDADVFAAGVKAPTRTEIKLKF